MALTQQFLMTLMFYVQMPYSHVQTPLFFYSMYINMMAIVLILCLQADMQQLVKDSNDPSRFRNVLVLKRELHKLLEEAKAARDSTGFLLNGVSEILFSPKELESAKDVTKARAGTAVLDEEKVDALFGKIFQMS